MKMTNKTYDSLKWFAWLWGPLLTLLVALINIWFVDYERSEQLIATLMAFDVFIGACVGYSNYKYNSSINSEGINEEETND